MDDIRKHDEHEIEGLIAAGLREVPSRSVEQQHLTAIVDEARLLASPDRFRRKTMLSTLLASVWMKAAAAAAAIVLGTGGLAAADALPRPAQDAVASAAAMFGLDLPSSDDFAVSDEAEELVGDTQEAEVEDETDEASENEAEEVEDDDADQPSDEVDDDQGEDEVDDDHGEDEADHEAEDEEADHEAEDDEADHEADDDEGDHESGDDDPDGDGEEIEDGSDEGPSDDAGLGDLEEEPHPDLEQPEEAAETAL